jgi:hypothetical protein
MAFTTLVGSKYAAIVAAGQNTVWFIENCRAIVKAHRELPEAQKPQVIDALNACAAANQKRTDLIHGVWGIGPGAKAYLLGSKRRDHNLRMSKPITVDYIESVDRDLNTATTRLQMALHGLPDLESQLRWEEHLASLTPGQLEQLEDIARSQAGATVQVSPESNAP